MRVTAELRTVADGLNLVHAVNVREGVELGIKSVEQVRHLAAEVMMLVPVGLRVRTCDGCAEPAKISRHGGHAAAAAGHTFAEEMVAEMEVKPTMSEK